MPRRCHRLLPALLLLLAAPAWAAPVRIFAVGHKQRLDDAVTYQTFRDKMAAMMDAAFPNRSTLVQAGVDDVASHLFPADPAAPPLALVVFPESAGLIAAFIGSRGLLARQGRPSAPKLARPLLLTYGPPHARQAHDRGRSHRRTP